MNKIFTKVCIKCGNAELSNPVLKPFSPNMRGLGTRWASGAGGLASPGIADLGVCYCEECGWMGIPVEVEDPKEFKKSLNKKTVK